MRKFILVSLLLASAILILIPSVVMAAAVTPTILSGNPTPDKILGLEGNYWYKVDPPHSGTFNKDGHSVQWTISVDGKSLNFDHASPGIIAVIVKGGPNANLYRYDIPMESDTSLRAPDNNGGNIPQISHVIFVWGVEPLRPVPEFPAGLLFGIGLAGVGGFVLIRRHNHPAAIKRVTN
jgi:hypothetical protein